MNRRFGQPRLPRGILHTLTEIRAPAPTYDVENGGQWVPGTPERIDFEGCVLPVSEDDWKTAAEGTYTANSRKIYTNGHVLRIGGQVYDPQDGARRSGSRRDPPAAPLRGRPQGGGGIEMTQRELRNIIVKQLHTYLAGPKVVLSDQTAPEADYPLIYYQSVQQHIPGAANITTAAADGGTLTKYRREHAEATFSFTACSFNRQGKDGPISGDDEALELADRAQGFFLFAGRQLLADLGVVVVRVENTQRRSAFDTDETDRRYGFDVLFRYDREDKRAVPAISKPPITFTKEE